MSNLRTFNVYLDGKEIDTVFYDRKMNLGKNKNERQNYVYDSLVNHDGYDSEIIVKEIRNVR